LFVAEGDRIRVSIQKHEVQYIAKSSAKFVSFASRSLCNLENAQVEQAELVAKRRAVVD